MLKTVHSKSPGNSGMCGSSFRSFPNRLGPGKKIKQYGILKTESMT